MLIRTTDQYYDLIRDTLCATEVKCQSIVNSRGWNRNAGEEQKAECNSVA